MQDCMKEINSIPANIRTKVNTEYLFLDFLFLFDGRYEVELEELKDEYAKTLEDAKKEKVLSASSLLQLLAFIDTCANRGLTTCVNFCRHC